MTWNLTNLNFYFFQNILLFTLSLLFVIEFQVITRDYFRFNTFSRIDIKENQKDNNSPVISFIFQELNAFSFLFIHHYENIKFLMKYRTPKENRVLPRNEHFINFADLTSKQILNRTLFYKVHCMNSEIDIEHIEKHKNLSVGYCVDNQIIDSKNLIYSMLSVNSSFKENNLKQVISSMKWINNLLYISKNLIFL